MTKARRFQLDELTLRPGTYFNPQTEILIVVDDSPEIDHEIFEGDEFDGVDWVLISEDSPLDEHRRDELVERFELTHQPGSGPVSEDHLEGDDEEEDDELDGVDELEGVDDLDPGHE